MEQYSVSSNGVPIGVTDLRFAPIDGPDRWGWFIPNADGERLMPVVTAMHRALRASAHRVRPGLDVVVYALPPKGDASAQAELDAAWERVEALGLTLHRADGALIPTDSIGIQDVLELLGFWQDEDETSDGLDDRWAEGLDEETRAAIEHDVAMVLDDIDVPDFEDVDIDLDPDADPDDDFDDDFDLTSITTFDEREPWMRGGEAMEMRYQIHVRLANPWSIP